MSPDIKLETMTCPHGVPIGGEPWPEGFAWAGPSGTCRCCKGWFTFMGSGIFEGGRHSGTMYTPLDLCEKCGGRYWFFDSAEIDALVAEHVMGLKVAKRRERCGSRMMDSGDWEPLLRDKWVLADTDKPVPGYSVKEARTAEVVKKLESEGATFGLLDLGDDLWQAQFDKDGHGGEHIGRDPDLATCYAALKFRGITPPGCFDTDGIW